MMKFINKNIHWILLLLLVLFVASTLIRPFYFGVSSWDLNRTTGWGWDVSGVIWWVVFNPIPLIVIMSLGYWLLKIFKKLPLPILSTLNLLFLVVGFFYYVYSVFFLLAFICFVVNMVYAAVIKRAISTT